MIAPATLPAPGIDIAMAAHAALPVLTTERLELRAPLLSDFALFAEILASQRSTFLGGPMDEEQAWTEFTNYCAGWLLRGDGVFAVIKSGETIGFIFAGCEPGDEALELGFLMAADFEGEGYAFEAAKAALVHLFTIGAPEVVSYIDPENSRARALADRMGGVFVSSLDGVCVYHYTVGGIA